MRTGFVRPSMLERIEACLKASMDVRPEANLWQVLKCLDGNFGAQAIIVYRFGCWLKALRWYFRILLSPLFLLYWLARCFVSYFYDIRLDLSAQIGPEFRIWHFGGIHISQCQIGANCTIHQCVQIRPGDGDDSGPRLGSNIWIGPHASILGAITVGDGAAVAAAAEVRDDIPERSLVGGRPARIIKQDYDNQLLFG